MEQWSLYLIRCNSGQLYTGITTDVDRRFAEHQQGKGAKFLRGKGPLELVFTALIGDRSDALKMEIRVKKLRRSEKEALIQRGAMT
ncbi:GIY-YIG nuclease family protein [Mariprofundus sp. KV]|uniref:GIY-YIG nuclease family protein n=1 Tax=Mariprofundus sp. KV TaxID=2608715 RepID=UPI0015A12A35|nr:GIY-YIG nuclease family protein [Mariprofundus sp. KV]